jgi:hypothetical protein
MERAIEFDVPFDDVHVVVEQDGGVGSVEPLEQVV